MINPIRPFFRPFQDSDDKIFSILLNKEFSKDLEAAVFLSAIPESERSSITISLIDSLRQKYLEKNRLRKYASKNLRKEYDGIYSEISKILYN